MQCPLKKKNRDRKSDKRGTERLSDRYIRQCLWRDNFGKRKCHEFTAGEINEKRRLIRLKRENTKPRLSENIREYQQIKERLYQCDNCGTLFYRLRLNEKYCSDVCRKYAAKIKALRVNELKKGKTERRCRECGEVFTPEYGNKRRIFCGASCMRKNVNRATRALRKAKSRGNDVEAFNPLDIMMRDKWKCQLCGRKTPRKLRGTINDCAPELDHIIPLSIGGEHSKRNTQCLCRMCNQNKGARTVGQLRLFG